MNATPLASWTVVVSESSPISIEKLSNLIDFGNPPDFFEFVCRQWELRKEGDSGPWDLLMGEQMILRAVGHQAVLSLKQAVTLTRFSIRNCNAGSLRIAYTRKKCLPRK